MFVKTCDEIKKIKQDNQTSSDNKQLLHLIQIGKEIEKIKNDIEIIKNDKIKDNKIIHDYENENIMLGNKVAEFEKLIESKKKKTQIKEKNDEKISIVKTSVQKMMNNFNRNLDLNDKNNVKFVENLNSKLK